MPTPGHQGSVVAAQFHHEGSTLNLLGNFNRSPLPPPDELREYAVIHPAFPERLLAMAERQAAHRQRLESRTVTHEALGIGSAFVIALAGLCLGAYVGIHGNPFVGSVLGGTPLATLAGLFLRKAREKNTPEAPPNRELPEPPPNA